MSHHVITRATSMGALASTLWLASAAVHAQAASGGCDRACLRQMLDTYLTAVFKHDPSAVPLTADHYATENTAVVHNGEGFWKDLSGYGEVQRRYFDPMNESAAFLGLLKQDGQDRITSVRIKVEGGKISEAEWIISYPSSDGKRVPNPQGMIANPPPQGALPASQRTSRFLLKSIADDFYQAFSDHYGLWVPSEASCMAYEIGGRGGQCHSLNFESAADSTKDVELRRYPLVDEEAGIVLCDVIFVRFPGVARQDNLVNEYMWIRSGKVAGWWTSMDFLPMGSPVTSGWENRKGEIIR